jgi:hypothetical protein
VGFLSEDTFDDFPQDFLITLKGDIILWDVVNERIMDFNANGKLHKLFKPEQKIGMILKLVWGIIDNSNIIIKTAASYRIYNANGDFVRKFIGVETNIEKLKVLPDNSIVVYKYDENKYYKYSPIGELLKTYDMRPLELGVINENSLGGGKYKTTIQYPDITYATDRLTYHNYIRGCDQMLSATLYEEVVKYNEKSELIGDLVMPKAERKVIRPAGNGADELTELIVEYGDPIVAPNGDIYTWKRTPDKYSIIKWIWVDGPECPQNLEVKPTANSLKFTWQKPLKDAEKVSYYQLLQSYNICGPFRQVNLIKKDQLSYEDRDVKKGETYYYVVKAVRGRDYSGNSNKVCGQVE